MGRRIKVGRLCPRLKKPYDPGSGPQGLIHPLTEIEKPVKKVRVSDTIRETPPGPEMYEAARCSGRWVRTARY